MWEVGGDMGLEEASTMSPTISFTEPSRNRYGGPRTPCAAKCASSRRGRHHSASATRAATCSASHADSSTAAARHDTQPRHAHAAASISSPIAAAVAGRLSSPVSVS